MQHRFLLASRLPTDYNAVRFPTQQQVEVALFPKGARMDPIALVITLVVGVLIGAALGALMMYLYDASRLAQLQAQQTADSDKLSWLRRTQEDMQKVFSPGIQNPSQANRGLFRPAESNSESPRPQRAEQH